MTTAKSKKTRDHEARRRAAGEVAKRVWIPNTASAIQRLRDFAALLRGEAKRKDGE